jgi:hypothetical protein
MAAGTERPNLKTGGSRRYSLHRKVELSRCAAEGGERWLHESGSVQFSLAGQWPSLKGTLPGL